MNKDDIKENWSEIKGRLQEYWGELTDNDIQNMKGTYDDLQNVLRNKYGYEKKDAKREIENFLEDADYDL